MCNRAQQLGGGSTFYGCLIACQTYHVAATKRTAGIPTPTPAIHKHQLWSVWLWTPSRQTWALLWRLTPLAKLTAVIESAYTDLYKEEGNA